MSKNLEDLWAEAEFDLPDGWQFDGITRGLFVWVATAVLKGGDQKIQIASEDPTDALGGMIAKVREGESHG